MRWVLGVSLFLFGACSRPPEAKRSASSVVRSAAPSVAAPPPSTFDYDADGFVYARLEKTAAPVPARFSAALPTSLDEFERVEAYPPHGQLALALCNGDRDVAAGYLTAIRAAARRGAIDEPLREAFTGLAGYCDSKLFCEWGAAAASTEADRRVREILFAAIEECGMTALPALERDSEADQALLNLYFKSFGAELPFTPRLQKAVRTLVKKKKGKELRTLAIALSNVKDERVVAFIEATRKPLDPGSRAWLGLALRDQPKAKTQFLEACEHRDLEGEPMCSRSSWERESSAVGSFEDQVMERSIASEKWLAEHPDRAVLLKLALKSCVKRASKAYQRGDCLSDLATHFWADAHALVQRTGKPAFADEPYQRELANALFRFATQAELVEHLRGLGLVPEGLVLRPPQDEDEHDVTSARGVLRAARRLHDFDVETDQYPNEHDALLVELARLAGQELSDVRFEELAPDPDGPRSEDGEGVEPYRLRAYASGQRYELDAVDYGDWYDLEAVLGLLNSLSRERGSSVRFLPLYTGDQTASVAVGKRDALLQLVKDGLLAVSESESARESGQAYEREVLGGSND